MSSATLVKKGGKLTFAAGASVTETCSGSGHSAGGEIEHLFGSAMDRFESLAANRKRWCGRSYASDGIKGWKRARILTWIKDVPRQHTSLARRFRWLGGKNVRKMG